MIWVTNYSFPGLDGIFELLGGYLIVLKHAINESNWELIKLSSIH